MTDPSVPVCSWSDVYEYFEEGGLSFFLFAGITDLVIAFLVALSPIVLFGCIDFSRVPESSHLGEVICSLVKGFAKVPLVVRICCLIFTVFTVVKFVMFILKSVRFFRMRRYYVQTLGIDDSELARMSWGHIIESVSVNDNALDAPRLVIAQQIMRRDNYVCGIVSDPSLLIWKFPPTARVHSPIPMSRFFFTWLQLGLLGIVLDRRGCSLVNAGSQAGQAPRRLSFRFRLIGVLLFMFSPVVLAFQVLYFVYEIARTLRECGFTFSLRSWSPAAKWLIREYNELPHFFRERLRQSYVWANAYLDHSVNFYAPVARASSFLSGCLIVVLLLFSLVTDISLVLSSKLLFGKSAAWYLVILTIVYGISRHLAFARPTETVESAMAGIERYTHMDFRDENHSAQSPHTRAKVATFFPTIWKTALMEMLSVILNPFLFSIFLPEKVPSIINLFRSNSVDAGPLGWVCAFGTFDIGERGFSGIVHHREKVLRSLRSFEADHDTANAEGEHGAPLIDMGLLPRASSPLMRNDFGSNDALSRLEEDPPLAEVFGDNV
jgi:autophagy-related protein 9